MNWLKSLLTNHVLANLMFGLVLVLGVIAYSKMPRARDPEINFNWINIVTIFPGAAAVDVERRITSPLEDAIQRSVRDMRFVSSTSRDNISSILVRFNEIDERTFDKRLADLRREVQNTYTDELPQDAEDPYVYEITTSNSFPSATVVVTGQGEDENLRRQARNAKKDLERVRGVDRVDKLGLPDPELHVRFLPERLVGLGITPADLADTVRAYFRDVSAGDVQTGDGEWIVRVTGTNADPSALAKYPVTTAQGVVELGSLAELSRSTEEPTELVRFNGKPAALLWVTKQADANVLQLVDDVREFVDARNALSGVTGVKLALVDDQTVSTREAISLMQNNALIGLVLVLVVAWAFLGTRISLLTSIGIPFSLCGTFLILYAAGFTLNNSVLLGVVIALGMLVDDAVVVVESIYQRLQQGMNGLQAALESLREVFAPVTTSVLTTMAAFLPLMLLPGILGSFMKVIPLVVTLALLVSLFEAYWMLPAHVIALRIDYSKRSRTQRLREAATHWVRLRYVQLLLKAMRYPLVSVFAVTLVFAVALGVVAAGKIRFNFFEGDPLRIFYVNVEMPRGTTLEQTDVMLRRIEKTVLTEFEPGELRASVTYAGQLFTETERYYGDNIGQILFSLLPARRGERSVREIADEVQQSVENFPGTSSVTVLRREGGPPKSRAINVKVRGDEFSEILAATDFLRAFMKSREVFSNVGIDYRPGNPELVLQLDGDAIKRAGLDPAVVNRSLQAFVDGELVTDFQDEGEEVKVRVLAKKGEWPDVQHLLGETLSLPGGRSIALGELVKTHYGYGQQNIRHYNFRRTVTLEADIDKDRVNTVQANRMIREEWERARAQFPNVELEFSGELDDIQESLDAIPILFLLGIGLIYLILGTQFRSYFQPLMILATVPLAFTGVVLGLLVTGNPLSLFTIYGVVALTGISVNASIVLISAANDRLTSGMSLLHATIYAARRRVIPILITSLTTIAGLFSLAAGLAGHSRVWGPVATAIVWGLAFSTVLTLIVIPLLYRTFMARTWREAAAERAAAAGNP